MAFQTIVLKGATRHDERKAGGAVRPGSLLDLDAMGKFVVHGNPGGPANMFFACEDALQGKTVDDDYASNDIVSAAAVGPGDQVLALLKDGVTTTIGAMLSSAGDGSLLLAVEGHTVVAQAEEVVVASGSNARIVVSGATGVMQ